MTNSNGKTCTLCGEEPSDRFDLTGMKVVDGEEKHYQICRKCCFDVGRLNPYDQKSSSKRKTFWEDVLNNI